MLAVLGVEMRRCVVVVEHTNNDSKEAADFGHGESLAGNSHGCKEPEAVKAPAAKTYRPGDLHRSCLCVVPLKSDVKAWKAFEMNRHSVTIGQIGAGPEADLSPFQVRMFGQDRGESCLDDRLAQKAVDATVEATQ